MYSVDVDTGGTMTDALVSGGATPLAVKVETTPHDVTVCFLAILKEAAAALSFPSLTAFLDEVDYIRWSSTLTSNVLAQRTGSKLGLLVSAGREADLYDPDPSTAEAVFGSLIKREHVVGLPPGADRATILSEVRRLINFGIRRINVSLGGAFPDGQAELEVARVVAEQYPNHFLGSIPVLCGSELLMRPDDAARTVFALLNSYVHSSLASSLFRAEDQVKAEHRWKGEILVGHVSGGFARIAKTRAVDTVESGPLFGTYGCGYVAAEQKLPRVIAVDVGGTTAKVSALAGGQPVMLPHGSLFGIPVRLPLPLLRSMALGGGSVARVAAGVVSLGPDSMGAAPGPACYGLGGREATLTDALVALGVVSPTAFLEGRRVLDVEQARDALRRAVAEPLGVSVDAAAERVCARAFDLLADLVRETVGEIGWDPRQSVLLAYGGNGPLFATAVAERLGVPEVRLFGLGHIFSAYGSARSDVVHVYERALLDGGAGEALAQAAAGLLLQARRDLRGEGFDPERAGYTFELSGKDGKARSLATTDTAALARQAAGAAYDLCRLTARFTVGRFSPAPASPATTAAAARGPGRASSLGGIKELPVFAWQRLRGVSLRGPAAVDGGTFTWLLGDGWSLDVDLRGDATARRTREG